jgi:hypothetical protein
MGSFDAGVSPPIRKFQTEMQILRLRLRMTDEEEFEIGRIIAYSHLWISFNESGMREGWKDGWLTAAQKLQQLPNKSAKSGSF